MVFSVGLEYFFSDERKRRVVAVVRKDDRFRFPERPGASEVPYFFECLDYPATERKMNAFLADFQSLPQEKNKPHQHPGIEFLYLLSGKLRIKIASDEYELDQGDSIYFDSGVQHCYRKAADTPCHAVIVTMP
jgi:quercetin dioxygenase-like cupin family protein